MPGIGSITDDRSRQPRKRYLKNAYAVRLCRGVQRVLRFQPSASADRKPRQKPKLFLFAIPENVFRFAVLNVVTVLHAHDRSDLACAIDFVPVDVR